MPDYDALDPDHYESRFQHVVREGYVNAHWRPRIIATINRYCRGKHVLDLGCGYGNYTRTIDGAAFVVGLDLSKRWLDYARGRLRLKHLVRADAHHVPLANESVDVIVSVGLLEFVDPNIAIGEIARVLTSAGYCIVESSNQYSAFRVVLRMLLWILGRGYDRREPSYSQLISTFARHDIVLVEAWMDDGLIWLPDWLDQLIGRPTYMLVERAFARFGRNPFSNTMLVVGRKRASPLQNNHDEGHVA